MKTFNWDPLKNEKLNMARLDKEEKALVRTFEKGEWKRVRKAASEIERYRSYARGAVLKDRRINIRISRQDLEGIRKRAAEEGMPYQTLISSILHKFVTHRLREKSA